MTRPPGFTLPGFTLVEMLAALVVIGMVVAALGQGVGFGVLAWRGFTRSAAALGLEPAERTLRQVIADADPDGTAPGFTGAPHTLGLVSRLPASLGQTRAVMALGVDGARRLVLRWTAAPHARALGPAPAGETVLAEGVAGLDLAYAAAGQGWETRWTGPAPPALVRLVVRFPAGDPRAWPGIVAAPRRSAAE